MNLDKARAIAHRWNEHVKAKQLAMAFPGLVPKAKMLSGFAREGAEFVQGMADSAEFVASGTNADETHWWKAYAEHSAVYGRLHRAAVEDGAVNRHCRTKSASRFSDRIAIGAGQPRNGDLIDDLVRQKMPDLFVVAAG
jgi:hypothetical protein